MHKITIKKFVTGLNPYNEIITEEDQLFIMPDFSLPKKVFSSLLYKAADMLDAGTLRLEDVEDYIVDDLISHLKDSMKHALADHYLRTYLRNFVDLREYSN
jgi:hypothetical protein